MNSIRLDLLALVWPTECVACGAPDRDCCDSCLVELRAPHRARRVREIVPGGDGSGTVRGTGTAGSGAYRDEARGRASIPVYAAGPYSGPLRALLVACKHRGQTVFGRELGARLEPVLRRALARTQSSVRARMPVTAPAAVPGPPLLVCVPSRRSRVRERGYRHVELITAAALARFWTSSETGAAAHPRLRQIRALRPLPGRTGQVGLSAAERERNAHRVAVRRFARSRLRGREVILIDDVITTGATVVAACEKLAAAGARVVAVAALCSVARDDGSTPGDAPPETGTLEK